jgi:hypothetical protein
LLAGTVPLNAVPAFSKRKDKDMDIRDQTVLEAHKVRQATLVADITANDLPSLKMEAKKKLTADVSALVEQRQREAAKAIAEEAAARAAANREQRMADINDEKAKLKAQIAALEAEAKAMK